MTTSDVQSEALPATITASADDAGGEHIYLMSRQGKRQAILLLLGVASIWIFALWSLITILQDGVNGVEWVSLLLMIGMYVVAPAVAWTLLEEADARIVTDSKGIEYRTVAGITLRYNWEQVEGFKAKEGRSRIARFFLGDDNEPDIDDNRAKNAEAREPRPVGNDTTVELSGKAVAARTDAEGANKPDDASNADDEDEDEPETLLLKVRNDHTAQIANPLLRWLHSQAHGPSLPIYGSLENRAQLLSEIAAHRDVKRET